MGIIETFLPNLPTEEYGLMNGFFYPFLLTLIMFFGALEAARVFKPRINLLLSLIMTGLAVASPFFGWFATQLVPLGGYVAIVMFVSIFIVGSLFWGHTQAHRIYYTHGDRTTRLEKVGKQIDKLEEKFIDAQIAGDERQMRILAESINRLKAQRELDARRH